jgi:hypothetical protein
MSKLPANLTSTCSVGAVVLGLALSLFVSIPVACAQGPADGQQNDKDLNRTLKMIDQHLDRETERNSIYYDYKKKGTQTIDFNEEARINADAQHAKEIVLNNDFAVKRQRFLRMPEEQIVPCDDTQRAIAEIEERRQIDIKKARAARDLKLEEASRNGSQRERVLNSAAENLRTQLANPTLAPAGQKAYGIKAVGTNLYVRQYGAPEVAREVHNAAAKVVPYGTTSLPSQ